MSKTNPNQDYYKTGGREQTDGPDRGEQAGARGSEQLSRAAKDAHPAVKRAAKKK